MSRILLTGASGQVGKELQRTLAPLGEVIAADRRLLDLSTPTSLREAVQQLQPNLIVNAAAYTAVDRAETEITLAETVNGVAVQQLAKAAQNLGVGLIHLSTDYVFDGRKNTPYLEDDQPNPIGAYGRSKRLGEENILQVFQTASEKTPSYVILRTAWVYGAYGSVNFVKTMLRLGAEREELRVVADQIGTPTWARDLANAVTGLAVRSLNQAAPLLLAEGATALPSGVYHYTNSGVASWYDFAIAIFEEAALLGFPLKVQRVTPIRTEDYPTPAKRPAYSVLSQQKTVDLLGSHAPYWRQSLRQMLTELYTQTYESNRSIGW